MDITCPHCAAAYRVPDALLAPGKKLRCAACKADWAPVPAASPPSAPEASAPPPPVASPPPVPPVAAPAPAPARPEPEAPPPRPLAPRDDLPPPPPLLPVADPRRIRAAHEGGRSASRRLLPLAWAASLAAVVGLLVALVVLRGPIAAAWPPFARLGQVLGG